MNGKIISQLLFEEGHFLVEGKYTKGVLELEAATDISGSIVFSITGSPWSMHQNRTRILLASLEFDPVADFQIAQVQEKNQL